MVISSYGWTYTINLHHLCSAYLQYSSFLFLYSTNRKVHKVVMSKQESQNQHQRKKNNSMKNQYGIYYKLHNSLISRRKPIYIYITFNFLKDIYFHLCVALRGEKWKPYHCFSTTLNLIALQANLTTIFRLFLEMQKVFKALLKIKARGCAHAYLMFSIKYCLNHF